jgi:hypothetical protein
VGRFNTVLGDDVVPSLVPMSTGRLRFIIKTHIEFLSNRTKQLGFRDGREVNIYIATPLQDLLKTHFGALFEAQWCVIIPFM